MGLLEPSWTRSTSTVLQSSLPGAGWAGQRQREFRVLEGLRPRGVPEEAIPFPEVLGYWGFRVEKGEELRACLAKAPWCCAEAGDTEEPWPCRAGPRNPTSGSQTHKEAQSFKPMPGLSPEMYPQLL